MAGRNAVILHEGGTTSSIATYCYMTGNALGVVCDRVYVVRGGWKHLMGDEKLVKGKHYHDFEDLDIDFRSRENPMGSDRACPVPTPKKPDANYTDRVIGHLKDLDAGVVVEKGGDDGAWIAAYLTEPLRSEGISIFHSPKTIDLDLYTGTKFWTGVVSDTPGARSAIINIAEAPAINNLKFEAHDTDRVFALEVMGRKCGELSLAVAYRIGADYCLIPEVPMTQERIDRLMGKIKPGQIVVVSEGATWWNPQEGRCTEFYVYRQDDRGQLIPVVDTHGRKKLGKAGEGVAEAIEKATKIDARDQATGYMGRSGLPCQGDIEYESVLSRKIAKEFNDGKTGVMPALAEVVPFREMTHKLHTIDLPTTECGYGDFKSRMVQRFDTGRFYDEKEFRWTKDFQVLVDAMLS